MSTPKWLDIIRREALHVHFHGQTKSTVICTSYNPKTHAIKGILVPHGVETGWIPIGVAHAGNGYGILVGPKAGDPQKLDGDQFDVEFEFGDPNTPIARHRLFSTPDAPPEVQSGEILIQHDDGSKFFFAKDKSLTILHGVKNGSIVFDPKGNITMDSKNQNITVQSGTGSQTFTAKSQTFTAQNISLNGQIAVDGNITQNGSLTATGPVTGGDA